MCGNFILCGDFMMGVICVVEDEDIIYVDTSTSLVWPDQGCLSVVFPMGNMEQFSGINFLNCMNKPLILLTRTNL